MEKDADRLSTSKKAATSPGFCPDASLLANSAIGTGSRTTLVGGPGRGPEPGLAPPCFLTGRIGNLPLNIVTMFKFTRNIKEFRNLGSAAGRH